MNILQEKKLLRRIANNDEKAFRQIFDHYKERFYAAALKMTRSRNLSEEIVQEVFVSLWEHRSSLNKIENPQPYLFSIVYHTISAHLKKLATEKNMKQKMKNKAPKGKNFTEEAFEEKETRQLLQKIIQKLPSQQQIIYKLSKQEGLSRNEIAEQLHISPNTVKNHLLKATKYIRKHFEKALILVIIFMI